MMFISMRRISVTIPDRIAEALERIARTDPSNPTRSRIVSDALVRYIASVYPELLRKGPVEGPTVLIALRSAMPRAPSPTLRKAKLGLPKWSKVEG